MKEGVWHIVVTEDGGVVEHATLPDSTDERDLGLFDYEDGTYRVCLRAEGFLNACAQACEAVRQKLADDLKRREENPIYVSTYCNFAHRMSDGKPIEHECRIIPPKALQAEKDGNITEAIRLMQEAPVRIMRRGVRDVW